MKKKLNVSLILLCISPSWSYAQVFNDKFDNVKNKISKTIEGKNASQESIAEARDNAYKTWNELHRSVKKSENLSEEISKSQYNLQEYIESGAKNCTGPGETSCLNAIITNTQEVIKKQKEFAEHMKSGLYIQQMDGKKRKAFVKKIDNHINRIKNFEGYLDGKYRSSLQKLLRLNKGDLKKTLDTMSKDSRIIHEESADNFLTYKTYMVETKNAEVRDYKKTMIFSPKLKTHHF